MQTAPAISIGHDNATPEGTYTVIDSSSTITRPDSISFSVTACVPVVGAALRALRRQIPADSFLRCNVREVHSFVGGAAALQVIEWGAVTFSRYVSPAIGLQDWWIAAFSRSHRFSRIFIGTDRFVFHDGGSTDPGTGIIEAPIVR